MKKTQNHLQLGIGLNLGPVDKDRFIVDQSLLHQLTAKLDKALAQQLFDLRMDTEAIVGAITRFIPLGQPHQPYTIPEQSFYLSA